MPDLDLGPNDYKLRDPKTGRWQSPANPKLVAVYFVILVAGLVFVFVTRNEGTRESLFGITALLSIFAGLALGLSIRKTY